jgi:NAD(P)-dependent dehydrogenase (short-subunit alcohol dehydrogenase family)
MKVEGSVALVTGANRGIGKAIAEELLARGAAKVYAGVRDPSKVSDSRLAPVQLDVVDSTRFAEVAKELADVNLVVNNAGIARIGPPLQASIDDARQLLETNYLSIVTSTQAFTPVLAANGGGAFINMLSVLSWVAIPTLPAYAASKAAAWSYTNAARIQLKQKGIEVVGVHVGFVDTDLAAAYQGPKIPPTQVATSAIDALEAGQPEALVDDFTRHAKNSLPDDQNALYPRIAEQFPVPA